ncbi:MAG: hypothetical protein RR365_14805 [Bacteroides sp.]
MKIDRDQVKKELNDFNSWLRADSRRGGQFMADTSDGEVWAVCHIDENSRTTYHSDTIINVYQEMFMCGIDGFNYNTVVAFLEELPANSTGYKYKEDGC